MEATELLHEVEHIGVMLMALWGFIKIVKEAVDSINRRHDREQKWDEYERNLKEERDKIYVKYDAELADMKSLIDANHADTGARLQELAAMITVLTRGQLAALEGLKQQGCNGAVTQAKKELDDFLMQRAVDI